MRQSTSQEVNLIFLRAEQLLHAALTYVPTLQEDIRCYVSGIEKSSRSRTVI